MIMSGLLFSAFAVILTRSSHHFSFDPCLLLVVDSSQFYHHCLLALNTLHVLVDYVWHSDILWELEMSMHKLGCTQIPLMSCIPYMMYRLSFSFPGASLPDALAI